MVNELLTYENIAKFAQHQMQTRDRIGLPSAVSRH